MKPEEMLKYASEYEISERELNWLTSPYQKIKHVTKFEITKNTISLAPVAVRPEFQKRALEANS
jgi:hypothetical protein